MRMVRFGYGDEEENTDRQRDGIEEMGRNDSRTEGTEYSEGYECGAEEAPGDAESETLRTGAERGQKTVGEEGWLRNGRRGSGRNEPDGRRQAVDQ